MHCCEECKEHSVSRHTPTISWNPMISSQFLIFVAGVVFPKSTHSLDFMRIHCESMTETWSLCLNGDAVLPLPKRRRWECWGFKGWYQFHSQRKELWPTIWVKQSLTLESDESLLLGWFFSCFSPLICGLFTCLPSLAAHVLCIDWGAFVQWDAVGWMQSDTWTTMEWRNMYHYHRVIKWERYIIPKHYTGR